MTPFTLNGLHEKPFYLRPELYSVLIYPVEWIGEIAIDQSLSQELSDIFYYRTFGRAMVYNLWTLFVKTPYLHWFEDDVALGYRNLLTDALPDEMPEIFYNEAFSLLQNARLKELRTETDFYRKPLEDDYTAIPLVPAPLAVNSVGYLSLGEAYDPVRLVGFLNELRNFVN